MKNKCLICGERIPDCKCIKMNIEEAKKILDDMRTWDCILPNRIQTEAIETVLNELEKKDAKIERLKNARDNWKKTYYQAETEIKERDKVIDEMARMLNNNDIDEDICRQMGKSINCNDYTKEENCIKCIKEYFYKKVEEK